MRAIVGVLIAAVLGSSAAEARGVGRLLGGMVARGGISAAGHAAAGTARAKSYTPNVLTVEQLVNCLKTADGLDKDSEDLNAKKAGLTAAGNMLDIDKAAIERRQSMVDTRSKRSVDTFNADVDAFNLKANRHKSAEDDFNRLVATHNASATAFNAECAKQYYADDMEAARKVAGL